MESVDHKLLQGLANKKTGNLKISGIYLYILFIYLFIDIHENYLYLTCNLQPAPATCNLQPATCNLQPATCNLQPATCNLQPATCKLHPPKRIVPVIALVNLPFVLQK